MVRLRLALTLRLLLAHLTGLAAIGLYASVGSNADFWGAFGFFFLIAGAFSLTIFVPLLVAVMAFAHWVETHLVAFVLGGPVLVCLGAAALAGAGVVPAIALMTGTASLVFALLAMLDWPAKQNAAP